MNVQFAVKGDDIFVLEVNPRASRTVPFVAKATGIPLAKIAARLMMGEKLRNFPLDAPPGRGKHVAVKEAVFPFARFSGVDILLGPEMRSTGEVMGIDRDFALAFAKSQLAAGTVLPSSGTVFISVRDADKPRLVSSARKLRSFGFEIAATAGTARFLAAEGVEAVPMNKVVEGPPHIVDAMIHDEIALVFNTTEGARSIRDSFSLRRTALVKNIPYYTTVAGAVAAVEAIEALRTRTMQVVPLQEYFASTYKAIR